MVRPQSRPVTRWTMATPRPGEFLRLERAAVGALTASGRPAPATMAPLSRWRPRTTF